MEFTEMNRAINKMILIGNLGRDMDHSMCAAFALRSERTSFETSKSSKGAMAWANISDGMPESGGGGASEVLTVEGGAPVAGASEDDDGGDPDPEPARRRPRKSSAHPGTLHPSQPPHSEVLLKLQAVQQRTSLSKSTIYAKIKDGTFPGPVRLGARCSRWKTSELNSWLSLVGQ